MVPRSAFPGSTIFLSSRVVPIYWGHFGVQEADLICLRDLMVAPSPSTAPGVGASLAVRPQPGGERDGGGHQQGGGGAGGGHPEARGLHRQLPTQGRGGDGEGRSGHIPLYVFR